MTDRHHQPNTKTTPLQRSNKGSKNSQSSINKPQNYPSTPSTALFPSSARYLFDIMPDRTNVEVPNWIPMGGVLVQPVALSGLEEPRNWHAYMAREARYNRKLARQSVSLNRNPCSSTFSTITTDRVTHGSQSNTIAQNNNKNVQEDPYTFCTPDNVKLRVLLKKELKMSDVKSERVSRIVLPKKDAEANLPSLSDREGIPITIRNLLSNQEWNLRYKFWINNNSRMYVLEDTREFVKQNMLKIGDTLFVHEDKSKNFYFSIKRVERPTCNPLYYNDNKVCTEPYTYKAGEEASLALLIDELRPKEHEAANNLVTLSMDGRSSTDNDCE